MVHTMDSEGVIVNYECRYGIYAMSIEPTENGKYKLMGLSEVLGMGNARYEDDIFRHEFDEIIAFNLLGFFSYVAFREENEWQIIKVVEKEEKSLFGKIRQVNYINDKELFRLFEEANVKLNLPKPKSYRELNTFVMNDTIEMCQDIYALRDSIKNSITKEYVVFQESALDVSPEKNEKMQILVTKKRTFEAASAYKGKKICCLDFANNHSIGGAPWTAGAQEESLCRISTLYPCMEAKKDEFYEKHKMQFAKHEIGHYGNDDLIYIPEVTVFKSDESAPAFLLQEEWFNTDVIVCAAPVLAFHYDEDEYKRIMTNRIKRILDVAEKEKVEVLILGAFGCGAFHNPPEVVAEIFKSMIKNYSFETVEFAVFCRDDTKNFDVFRERLGE